MRPPAVIVSLTLGLVAVGLKAQAPLVFRSEIGVVYLHATVRNERGELVTNLGPSAFTVYESGARQTLSVFRHDDVPISLGILLDNSGSMREARPLVEAAALAALRASNPADETFIMNFADKAKVDVPFMSDLAALSAGVARLDSIGGTALRDAIASALDHLEDHAKNQRKVLLVITDGNDNASETPMDRIKQQAERSDVAVYAVGLLHQGDPSKVERGRDALSALTESSGGLAQYPATADQAGAAAREIAGQMRHLYTLGYSPAAQMLDGSYRKVRVVAKGPERLHVRTRPGYWAKPTVPKRDGAGAP